MRIFVTGSGGFLGKYVVQSLLEHGHTDLVLGVRQNKSIQPLQNILDRFPEHKAKIIMANLMNLEQMKSALEGVDAVLHLAAGMKGAPADMYMNSVIASRNMLDAAVAVNVKRICLVSSFAVYNTNDLSTGALVSESTPVEADGVAKGVYAYTKVQQEHMFWDYHKRYGFHGTSVRPGVIFGPNGPGLSSRVGIGAFGRFASLGGNAPLPLTFVSNCAEAVVLALTKGENGAIFNAVDDAVPTCKEYLALYQQRVEKLKVITVPYRALHWASGMIERYHKKSKGQLPPLLTPYVVKSMFRPFSYTNSALKNIGWVPKITMREGLEKTLVKKD
jgi:nucleoside-diphosphate-sugar epimerase